jgi:protein ImuB
MPIDPNQPLALLVREKSADRLLALNDAAASLGLREGMVLADARAAVPDLVLHPVDPEADGEALMALAHWCGRYSPWVMVDGDDGILIDITGCAHLFGGEAAMIADLARHLVGFGLSNRIAIADRAAQAWAWCRFGEAGILNAQEAGERLRGLPVAGLRIPADLVGKLRRLGLERIGDLAAMPRASLLRRFDSCLALRLDQLFAEAEEPFVPLRPQTDFRARISWPEPIGRTDDIEAGIEKLANDLCASLEKARCGARRLRLTLLRLDGKALDITVGTSAPTFDPAHLCRLFRLELDGLDVGFGIELMLLEAHETAGIERRQHSLIADAADTRRAELDQLIDQLQNRLGRNAVCRLEPVQSHVPERAQRLAPIGEASRDDTAHWLAAMPRPLRILPHPRPLQAMAAVPDGPPIVLRQGRRRLRVMAASGPERILPEWWVEADQRRRARDYYDLVTEDGKRLWVFREGQFGSGDSPQWWLHGAFN